MIKYVLDLKGLEPGQFQGFFVDWPNPPLPDTHFKLLSQSDKLILALDDETGRIVGFITAVTDGILSAHIPLLEVLPVYQRRGIGHELVRRMLAELQEFYMIDLVCDAKLQPFYASFGMIPAMGMMIRNYERQSGMQITRAFKKKFEKLETERLIVRRFGENDLESIYAYRNDPEVARFQRFGSVTHAQLSRMIEELQFTEPSTPGQWFQFAFALRETGVLIGDCALRMDKEDAGRAEIGFTLARPYQGKGFATEGVGGVLAYAFTKLGLERIFALTDCENAPSIALLERLGMQREGHLRKNFFRKGERRDEYRYAILRDEWLEKKEGKK